MAVVCSRWQTRHPERLADRTPARHRRPTDTANPLLRDAEKLDRIQAAQSRRQHAEIARREIGSADKIPYPYAFESFSGFVLMLLNLAAALQDAVPFFDAPASSIEVQDAGGVFRRLDFLGGQQRPFDRLGAGRWIFFHGIHTPQGDGFL